MTPDLKHLLLHIKTTSFSILLSVICFLVSCGTKKAVVVNTDSESSQLIFLNYRITAQDNGKKSIQFINQIITDGKLKKHSNKYIDRGVPGDLECHQLDKNSNTIQTIIIKDPLKKHIEYLADSLNFKTKTVELKNSSFGLKLKLNPKAKYVTINEILENEESSNPLIKTKLY